MLQDWWASSAGQAMRAARDKLPIRAVQEPLRAALAAHDVILVCGDTGCGKTTQVCVLRTHANATSMLLLQAVYSSVPASFFAPRLASLCHLYSILAGSAGRNWYPIGVCVCGCVVVCVCVCVPVCVCDMQVPQYLLEELTLAGQGSRAQIICTQPRRIAAMSVAYRCVTGLLVLPVNPHMLQSQKARRLHAVKLQAISTTTGMAVSWPVRTKLG